MSKDTKGGIEITSADTQALIDVINEQRATIDEQRWEISKLRDVIEVQEGELCDALDGLDAEGRATYKLNAVGWALLCVVALFLSFIILKASGLI